MSVAAYPAWPLRFEYANQSYVFSTAAMEWSDRQELRYRVEDVPFGHYGLSSVGLGAAPRGVAEVSIRYVEVGQNALVVEQRLRELRAFMARAGLGKLWIRDAQNAQFWCWARPRAMPEVTYGVDHTRLVPVTLTFYRLSDWYGATQQSVSVQSTISPRLFVVGPVGGTIATREVEIEITANGVNGFVNPFVLNGDTDHQFQVTATATAAGQKILVAPTDNMSWRARFFNGTSWTQVPLTIGQYQTEVMRLLVGSQMFSVQNVTNGTITVRWYDAYA